MEKEEKETREKGCVRRSRGKGGGEKVEGRERGSGWVGSGKYGGRWWRVRSDRKKRIRSKR